MSFIFLVLVVVGIIYVVRWSEGSTGVDGDSKQNKRMQDYAGEGSEPVIKTPGVVILRKLDAVRSKIEDLYNQKKITIEGLRELLSFLKISVPSVKDSTGGQAQAAGETEGIQDAARAADAGGAAKSEVEKKSSAAAEPATGFFNISNIKTMLVSGSVLFVLSGYLFIRAYWAVIPDIVKFLILVAITCGVYAAGRKILQVDKLRRTAETILSVSILLVPVNIFALNTLVINNALDGYTAWMLGSMAMFAAALFTAVRLPSFGMGILMSISFSGIFFFCGLSFDLAGQDLFFITALSAGALFGGGMLSGRWQEIQKAAVYTANIVIALLLFSIVMCGFFINESGELAVSGILIIAGVIFAVQARLRDHRFAYGAGLCFMAAGVMLLHYFDVPVYKYGLAFVPVGLVLIIRAWSFKRAGREELSEPYFNLGQMSVAGSVFAILPYFGFYMESAFMTLIIIMVFALAAYTAMGFMYRQPAFSYAFGATLLFMAWIFIFHYRYSLASGIIAYAVVAYFFLIISMVFRNKSNDIIAVPFGIIGFITLAVSLGLLGGKWGAKLLEAGSVTTGLTPEQLNAGLWVSGLSVVAYAALAFIKRSREHIYPMLACATLGYMFMLDKAAVPINLINMSWIVVASMVLFYGFYAKGHESFGRSFAIWGELVFLGIMMSSLVALSSNALTAMVICLAVTLPAIFIGHKDISTVFLLGVYAVHYIAFRRYFPQFNTEAVSSYALQLILVNSAVIFMRSLITFGRPRVNIEPFRIVAVFFSVISMFLSVSDASTAWQVFLAHGIIAIVVSMVHYKGRYNFLGAALLVIAYEFFIKFHNVELTEAYSVLPALYLIICGLFYKEDKKLRDMLYIAGMCVLYIPSFLEAVTETWGLHGVFLGVVSIAVMLFGMSQRNKTLVVGSTFVLIVNALLQSKNYFHGMPRWVYLGLGGITLITLGGLFEFKRETLIALKNRVVNVFEEWE